MIVFFSNTIQVSLRAFFWQLSFEKQNEKKRCLHPKSEFWNSMAHRKFSPTFPGDLKASKFSLPCPPFWTEESKRKKKPQPSCCAWLFPIHSSVRLLKVNKKKKIQVSSSCLNRASSREGSNPSREKLIELIWKDTNFFLNTFGQAPFRRKETKSPLF